MFAERWTRVQTGSIAIVAAFAWIVQSVVSIALTEPTGVLDLTMIFPMTLTLLAVFALRGIGFIDRDTFGTVAVTLFSISIVAAIPGQIAMGRSIDSLNWLAIPVSAVGFVLGLLLIGISIIRTAMAPRWTGIALLLAQPLVMVIALALSPISPLVESGDYSGASGHGIVWALIGFSLLGKQVPYLRPSVAERGG